MQFNASPRGSINIFFFFFHSIICGIFLVLVQTWSAGARYNRLDAAVLTSTHDLCFEHK